MCRAVYWDYCRPDVLVMERIRGVPIREVQALRDAGVDIPELAARGVQIFFTQVFRDSFFHADMHPGNVFVDISDPKNPRYAAVDFGIVGILDERDHHYLGQTLLGFLRAGLRAFGAAAPVLGMGCAQYPCGGSGGRISRYRRADI